MLSDAIYWLDDAQMATFAAGFVDTRPIDYDIALGRVEAAFRRAAHHAQRLAAMQGGRRLSVEVHLPSHDIRAQGDELALLVVFGALFDNAVRYAADERPIRVVLHADVTETSVCLRVADDGPGIDALDRPHVFDAGYRGSRAESLTPVGLGMGLHEVCLFVERMGGRIRLHERDRGATFEISLRRKS